MSQTYFIILSVVTDLKMRLNQAFSNLIILAGVGGPQQREFLKEILQVKQVSYNEINFEKILFLSNSL